MRSDLGLVIGFLFIVAGIFLYLTGMRESNWPTVQGKVVSVEEIRVYRHRHETTEYRTKFSYEVDGKRYEHHTQLQHRDKPDQAITVHYDAKKPQNSTIDPTKEEFGGAALAIVGLVFILSSLFRKFRNRGGGGGSVLIDQ
jgi:hypothetical protein